MCVFISSIQSVVASTLIIWLNMVVGNILLHTRYRYQSTHEVGLDVLLLLCYNIFFFCKGPIFGKIFVLLYVCMLYKVHNSLQYFFSKIWNERKVFLFSFFEAKIVVLFVAANLILKSDNKIGIQKKIMNKLS